MLADDYVYHPDFDLGEFRYTLARYVKLLVRARYRCEPGFLNSEELAAWSLEDIDSDTWSAQHLMAQAAYALADLNTTFLPRCGSGGVRSTDDTTPEGRLIHAAVCLVPGEGGGPDHNGRLRAAARLLAEGKPVDWAGLVAWENLPAIRADLDLLPHPSKDQTAARLDSIGSKLTALVEREVVREWYTTEEFARHVGKAEFTVRAWCRNGRVEARKRTSGRGATPAWVVSHEELLRYQREGLRPAAPRGS